nr:hypothetical protein [Tanacetum cinerariifolium]
MFQCLSAKTIAWNEFSITMASAIICLADNQKFNFSKRKQRKEAETSHDESTDEDHVPTPSSDPLPSGEDSSILNEFMVFYTSLQEHILDLQEARAAQAKEIATLKKKGRTNNDEMFGVNDLVGEEVVMDSAAKPVTTIKDSAALTTDVTKDEITIVQAFDALKSVKPKVVVQEQEMSTTILAAATIVTIDVPTPRAKVILNRVFSVPTRVVNGVLQPVSPITVEQKLARKNELEARGTLLMALPDKH